jgi:hypothetical protein
MYRSYTYKPLHFKAELPEFIIVRKNSRCPQIFLILNNVTEITQNYSTEVVDELFRTTKTKAGTLCNHRCSRGEGGGGRGEGELRRGTSRTPSNDFETFGHRNAVKHENRGPQ